VASRSDAASGYSGMHGRPAAPAAAAAAQPLAPAGGAAAAAAVAAASGAARPSSALSEIQSEDANWLQGAALGGVASALRITVTDPVKRVSVRCLGPLW
jgi:hypothetical protein